jgi:hypothetical protein
MSHTSDACLWYIFAGDVRSKVSIVDPRNESRSSDMAPRPIWIQALGMPPITCKRIISIKIRDPGDPIGGLSLSGCRTLLMPTRIPYLYANYSLAGDRRQPICRRCEVKGFDCRPTQRKPVFRPYRRPFSVWMSHTSDACLWYILVKIRTMRMRVLP